MCQHMYWVEVRIAGGVGDWLWPVGGGEDRGWGRGWRLTAPFRSVLSVLARCCKGGADGVQVRSGSASVGVVGAQLSGPPKNIRDLGLFVFPPYLCVLALSPLLPGLSLQYSLGFCRFSLCLVSGRMAEWENG